MEHAKLQEILQKHQAWLNDQVGGERANLRGADLSGANLRGMGNMKHIKAIQADTWNIGYTHDTMQIGCQRHLIAEWWAFSDEEISRMDSRALEWWKVWKPILQAMIAASPAVPTGYVEDENNV